MDKISSQIVQFRVLYFSRTEKSAPPIRLAKLGLKAAVASRVSAQPGHRHSTGSEAAADGASAVSGVALAHYEAEQGADPQGGTSYADA
jgi:hypothetical protein